MALAILIICGTVAAAICTVGYVWRKRMPAWATLVCTVTLVAAFVGSVLGWAYVYDGAAIVNEGIGPMGQVLPAFERTLAANRNPPQPEDVYEVWVLGDSTHGEPGTMAGALEIAKSSAKVEALSLNCLYYPGFDGYVYFFLLNRLVTNPPDLLVIPLNLRSFGARWSGRNGNWFPVTERYCRWDKLNAATSLATAERRITWTGLLLRKLDFALFSSKSEGFLNGLKVRMAAWVESQQAALTGADATAFSVNRRPNKGKAKQEDLANIDYTDKQVFAERIDAEHPLVRAFRALSQLGAEYGIEVMYYTVQTPDPRANQEESFHDLGDQLKKDANVRYVEMLDVIPAREFVSFEHMNFSGLKRVANRLMAEIAVAREAGTKPAVAAESAR